MSPFNFEEQFPTLKPIGEGLSRFMRWLVRIFVIAPARFARRRYKPILAVIAVLIIAHSVVTLILGRRVRLEIEAIKAKGGTVALADFGKPKIPDSENAAAAFDKAFKLISTDQARKDLNALDHFLKPAERAERPELWNQARSVLRKYASVIPIVEEAVKRPKCRYPVKWEAGCAALFPHLWKVRQLVRILDSNAIVQARDGNMDEAIRSLKLAFAVGESLRNEPMLISQLVRRTATLMNSRALRDVIETGKMTEAHARRLYDALGERDYGAGFAKAMQGERAMGIWAFDYARTGRLDFASGPEPGRMSPVARALWSVVRFLWRPIFYADEMVYLASISPAVEHAKDPFRVPNRSRLSAHDNFPRYAVITSIMLPVFTRARAKADEAQARVAGDRIMLGLITCKARYGAYPTNLAELRAKLGWKIEEDPFSGKDFTYKPQGAGFLLYSVGENLKDDAARTVTERPLPQPASPGTPPMGPPASLAQPASAPPGSAPGMSPPSTTSRPEGFVYKNAKGDPVADIVWELSR